MAAEAQVNWLRRLGRRWVPSETRRALARQRHALRGWLGGDTSQFGEGRLLRALLPPGAPRWVVDVGAYDGVTYSLSYPLIRRGWQALLIEPNPAAFRLLAARHARNPRVRCLPTACGDQPATAALFVDANGPTGQEATLCTDDNPLLNARRGRHTLPVPVDTLTNLLAAHGAPARFGLLAVDAEGLDYEVLRGLDFERFSPLVIVTEDYPENAPKHLAKNQLLRDRGYTLNATAGCNALWTSRRP